MQWFLMALWAIWTWSQDREQERQKERTRLAALYVNPFLSAGEDLQSRIYNILELGGLRALRQRYPDGAYTAETLYLIVRYFGWETVGHRYGPYTQDPVVTRLASLPFSNSEAVQQSLEALRNAPDDGNLPGRARLAQAQHYLVDLLGYLEGKEGYRLFQGERKKCTGLLPPNTPAASAQLPVPDGAPLPQLGMPGQG